MERPITNGFNMTTEEVAEQRLKEDRKYAKYAERRRSYVKPVAEASIAAQCGHMFTAAEYEYQLTRANTLGYKLTAPECMYCKMLAKEPVPAGIANTPDELEQMIDDYISSTMTLDPIIPAGSPFVDPRCVGHRHSVVYKYRRFPRRPAECAYPIRFPHAMLSSFKTEGEYYVADGDFDRLCTVPVKSIF